MSAGHTELQIIAKGEPPPVSTPRQLRWIIRNITRTSNLEPDTGDIGYPDETSMRTVAGSLIGGVHVSPAPFATFGNPLAPREGIRPDATVYSHRDG